MQKINLIAQSVLELSHCENGYDNNNDDDDDTHPGWIIVRDGKYSVADKNDDNYGPRRNGVVYQMGVT